MDNACVASWSMIPILLPISLPISDLSNPILFNQSIHMRGTYRGLDPLDTLVLAKFRNILVIENLFSLSLNPLSYYPAHVSALILPTNGI